jgi:hypothetical protein
LSFRQIGVVRGYSAPSELADAEMTNSASCRRDSHVDDELAHVAGLDRVVLFVAFDEERLFRRRAKNLRPSTRA